MKFNNINELRKTYEVKASFYKKNDVTFRNYADIIRKGYKEDKIDAYIIMMNPGSCKPINDEDLKNSSSPESAIYINASDDPAQRRVMQIMDNIAFDKVRILNLFDCKEPDSNKAAQMASENYGFPISIFSHERRDELNKLTKDDAPYIVAYTVTGLVEYKKLALKFLADKKVYGVKKDNNDLSYYYLSPRSNPKIPNRLTAEEIITDIVFQIKSNE